MNEFTQANIEKWLMDFVASAPLTCANAEKLNVMSMAMKNLSLMGRTFTEEDARKWMSALNPPARWTMDQTTAVMNQRGYNHKPCVFWVAMNSLYSDYGHTMARYNIDRPEIWADMANDFIEDPDAVDGKIGRYYRDIVKH